MAIIHAQFHRDVSVILAFSHKRDATKQILQKLLSLCCLYINLKIACEIIAI